MKTKTGDRLTLQRLRQVIHYDVDTGVFTWKARELSGGYSEKMVAAWNRRWAGTEAGRVDGEGYRAISIDGVRYKAHRLAWMYVYGQLPNGQIDHINGSRDDNRIANLRTATPLDNARNAKINSNNKSGHVGVSWCPAAKKWQASIRDRGTQIYLGVFADKSEAIAARRAAQTQLGYHPNHGRSGQLAAMPEPETMNKEKAA